ncbi:MAG TPA: vanadium-dependent haloperoxidase [Vicinamibacteria bacterium]|nr:vanadium-dependent haloperoxidase [Vicinamibacteria bacterium]
MRRNLESQAGLRALAAGRMGAVGLLALISLPGPVRADVVTDWNLTTLQAAVAAGVNQRQQRVAAMVHAAMHDAVNSVAPQYEAYAVQVSPSGEASIEAAAVQAAYGVLIRLLPGQAAMLDAARSASLSQIPEGPVKEEGLAVGEAVAGQIVALRSTDGSDVQGTYTFGSGPGEYQRTPPTFGNPSIPAWRFVTPFVLNRGDQFRAEGPPRLDSDEWAADFNEVKRLGSVDSAARTAEQTEIALCGAEPALPMWNRVARSVTAQRQTGLVENARLFALLNLAMVDATIACWDSKYTYRFWRPVTAIPLADTDGNDATEADPAWTPLRTTPLHPEYPSAHACFSGAAAEVLTSFFGKDTAFSTATSTCPAGVVRTYDGFQALADEIGDSRIYIGYHFRSAIRHGANLGRQVGHWTSHRFLQPLEDPQSRAF